MAVVLLKTLAFASISLGSPVSLQLLDPNPPAHTASPLFSPPSNENPNAQKPKLTLSPSQWNDDAIEQENSPFISASNISMRPRGVYQCQATPPGSRELRREACIEALRTIPDLPELFTHRVTFGPREDHIYNVGLPRAYLSCACTLIYLRRYKTH